MNRKGTRTAAFRPSGWAARLYYCLESLVKQGYFTGNLKREL